MDEDMTAAEETAVLIALLLPLAFLFWQWWGASKPVRCTIYITSLFWWMCVLVYANIDGNCSGSLVFGYRSCGFLYDDTAEALAIMAVFFMAIGIVIWAVLFMFFVVPSLWRMVGNMRKQP